MTKIIESPATIHDRIALCVQKYGAGKNTVFAEKLGVSEGNIRGYIKGVVPKADVLENIVRTYDISPEWLLTGRGKMLKTKEPLSDTPADQKPSFSNKDNKSQANGQEDLDLSQQSLALPKSLPFIKYEHLADLHFPLDPECKYDGASTTRKFIECRAQFVTEYRQQDALPIIPPGSSVACKTISKDDVIDKALCLLILNGNVLIRKVSFGFDKEHYNTTNINGENPLELAKSEVLSIHRIMAYLVTYP